MERREFLSSAAMLAAVSAAAGSSSSASAKKGGKAGPVQTSLKGPHMDLSTQRGCRDAWARLAGNTDMKSTKYGWYSGIVQGVRPGEAIRDLVGFTGFSCAKLLPNDGGDPGYKKVLREIGFYTDLKSGEILEEWTNPYLKEKVKVVPVANDPFNHTITDFYPPPPSYGGLNAPKPPKIPMILDFRRHNNRLNWFSHINLFYPSALQPMKWPRENGSPFAQVTESFLYQIDWNEMQNAKKTSVEYNGTWSRTTPWLPWMLMGPTKGHCSYQCFMGAYDDINQIDRTLLDHVEKNYPKYMTAPDAWSDVSLSSLENYARQQKPAPIGPEGPPVAAEPELPAWFKALMQKGGGAPGGPPPKG
jgi:Protein of unknown function (DUF1838)